MIDCPYCGAENIPGIDDCEECGQPLSHVHGGGASNEVERALIKDRVHVLAPKQPCMVSPDVTVGEVLHQMATNRIGCVMIVDGGKPVGIFSERDALMKLNTEAATLSDRPISEFMTANPETLQDSAKIAFAVQRMDLGGYRHLPIVSGDDQLQGIISVRAILNYLTDRMTSAR
ncbi:MAG TPA: CBS domain-containing protein [Pirellulaceae bacterium]|nr:CBS domain-containing protein [Planctomycetales bacterium]MCB9938068.1 CBS domain-containing protein [Planctomycetaceae bacterium]HRX82472.1 CBS domain-containing protein [Pirellulaceae bacterium]